MRPSPEPNHVELVEAVKALANFAYSNRFSGAGILKGLKVSRIVGLYGTAGRDWLWGVLGNILDGEMLDACLPFAPAVLVLDLHYRIGEDRSDEAFHRCNAQFLANCVMCARMRHGWWSPRRYALVKTARKLRSELDEKGLDAWRSRGAVAVG